MAEGPIVVVPAPAGPQSGSCSQHDPNPGKLPPWWVSWYVPEDDMGKFELHFPWWVTGQTCREPCHLTVCAAVRAASEEQAKEVILASYDDRPTVVEWRFVDPRPADWSPFNGRTPPADWMDW